MKVTVNCISGFEDAFIAMYISKKSWTPELDNEIRKICRNVIDVDGSIKANCNKDEVEKFNKWLEILLRMGKKHITVLRYIDISVMTEGLHRGGQDDVDAHARRFDNRIIRSSTRLATFDQDEFSDYYKGKVMTTDMMMKKLNTFVPEEVYELTNGLYMTKSQYNAACKECDCELELENIWVKSPNGYVKKEYENNKDVKRGLYMLGIPSNFISKINLTEWAHVFGERNKDGGANPEVKEWAELVCGQIEKMHPQITREYVLSIEN